MLKDILINTAEQKILSFLVSHPDKGFYGQEISREIKVGKSAVNLALIKLWKNKILIREKRGRISIYSINSLYNSILNQFAVLNIILRLELLTNKLQSISKKVILYGSYAKARYTNESDLDLLVVSNKKKEVQDIIYEFQDKKDMPLIKPIIKLTVEWASLEKKDPIFYNEVIKGIVLYDQIYE